jgi:hypothetical protein
VSFYVSARDDPVNNSGNILKELVELLENSASSDVPDFLLQEYNDKYNRPAPQRRVPGGRPQYSFGGRDYRNGQFGGKGGKGRGKGNFTRAPRTDYH